MERNRRYQEWEPEWIRRNWMRECRKQLKKCIGYQIAV